MPTSVYIRRLLYAAAISTTTAVWGQQLCSGEVHLQPEAIRLYSSIIPDLSAPELMALWLMALYSKLYSDLSLVPSLPALTVVAVLSLPDYSGGDVVGLRGQTDPHQPTSDPPLRALGC